MSKLTLEEAIKHCAEKTDCTECGQQHAQLGEWLKELQRYKNLEEQGKLILHPREAYFIRNKEVHKGWVQKISNFVSRKPLYDIRYDDYSLDSYKGYLGNTVFLTKEEAEAKLKGTEE